MNPRPLADASIFTRPLEREAKVWLGADLMVCLRSPWVRRFLLILLLIVGSAIGSAEHYPGDHRPFESAGHQLCLDDGECLPLAVMPPQVVEIPVKDVPPRWASCREIREQAREPEHAPPRQG